MKDNSNGNWLTDDWKLTAFIADQNGIFQNRDDNNEKITQMETWNQFADTGNLQTS